jgi:hypothetical protein
MGNKKIWEFSFHKGWSLSLSQEEVWSKRISAYFLCGGVWGGTWKNFESPLLKKIRGAENFGFWE